MFCNKCGNEIKERQVFCNKCGNRLVDIKDFKLNEIKNNIQNATNNAGNNLGLNYNHQINNNTMNYNQQPNTNSNFNYNQPSNNANIGMNYNQQSNINNNVNYNRPSNNTNIGMNYNQQSNTNSNFDYNQPRNNTNIGMNYNQQSNANSNVNFNQPSNNTNIGKNYNQQSKVNTNANYYSQQSRPNGTMNNQQSNIKNPMNYTNVANNGAMGYTQQFNNNVNTSKAVKHKSGKKNTVLPITITTLLVILMIGYFVVFVFTNGSGDYYFSDGGNDNSGNGTLVPGQSQTNRKGKYATAIITDNTYTGVSIRNNQDAINLIKKDSEDQKQSDYPKEIIEIENELINKYSIPAVNLKEMDVDFAKELANVVKKIYNEFPKARGYLTNLTLTNLDMSQGEIIALFMPIFTFAQSDTSTTRPWVIKTQVQLNSRYFLNPDRITTSVEASSKVGHFPKNATRNSPVAHEFGHYLSFIALLNSYSEDSILVVEDNDMRNFYNIYTDFQYGKFSKKMLDEAYKNYQNDGGKLGFDQWRGQISQYALAKNESGQYIYDETIAESFHDVYLNGNNANEASKYIYKVLKKYVGG